MVPEMLVHTCLRSSCDLWLAHPMPPTSMFMVNAGHKNGEKNILWTIFHFLFQTNCNKKGGSQKKFEILPFLECKRENSVSLGFLFLGLTSGCHKKWGKWGKGEWGKH